ncbi:uncharacterized protein [Hemitrygon akajei]|uniref:uncharacterized protein n=1 Tax=Hemitrygon akajei TaxID=2704970 RepID=UPI003BF9AFA3
MNRTQRQCQQRVHELISTLESRTFENSLPDLSQRSGLNNLSTPNNITLLNLALSDLNRTHSDLRHQFNQLERKYRNITENKAEICQYLTRRREQTCSQDWIKNEDRCYFISKVIKFYDGARQHCSEHDSRLLEINSNEEKKFVSNAVNRSVTYWIGKCADRSVDSDLLYNLKYGSLTCNKCGWDYSCKSHYRFICEKSAPLYPDIPEEIRGLCQHPVGPTSIK